MYIGKKILLLTFVMLFITALYVLLHTDVFIMRLPLLGLENARMLGQIRKQHTVTVLCVAENLVLRALRGHHQLNRTDFSELWTFGPEHHSIANS